jgi:thiol:disulfide interchange protein
LLPDILLPTNFPNLSNGIKWGRFGEVKNLKLAVFVIFFSLMLMFAALTSFAQSQDDFLAPDVAFRFSAKMLDNKIVSVRYDIAPGYYMYRERFKFSVDGAKLGTPVFPEGQIKFDENFQKNVEIYHDAVTFSLPIELTASVSNVVLHAIGQGCAEKGLCYPPMNSVMELKTKNASLAPQNGIALAHKNKVAPLLSSSKVVSSYISVEQKNTACHSRNISGFSNFRILSEFSSSSSTSDISNVANA